MYAGLRVRRFAHSVKQSGGADEAGRVRGDAQRIRVVLPRQSLMLETNLEALLSTATNVLALIASPSAMYPTDFLHL